MKFLSGIFFVFLFVTCLLYFIFPLKARWFVLLLSSVIFYLSWGWQALPVVLVTSLMVYLAALFLTDLLAFCHKFHLDCGSPACPET